MSISNNLQRRLDINNDTDNYQYYDKKHMGLKNMQLRLNSYGGTDQWTRMREDKLRSLKKALLYSYQSAIVQKYDVEKDNLANNLINIITFLQDQKELSTNQISILQSLEQDYTFLNGNRYSQAYIHDLNNIIDGLTSAQPLFRCLINHDKLKVDYEDKIISIPFFEPPVGRVDPIETDFHNGTVFKWVHGNKEEWTPDTYWIVFMQYSQETAYFRAEIRKADQEIEIIIIDADGNQSTVSYRGWISGPNETEVVWNIKKGVIWNDMNYTKLLYITKDENTLAFFDRFDRVVINGQSWEVQAYNADYTTSKTANGSSGIIRVALKETYTSTDQVLKERAATQSQAEQIQVQQEITEARIDGPTSAKPFSTIKFVAKGFEGNNLGWSISDSSLANITNISNDGTIVTIDIITGFSNKEGFYVNYGESDETKVKVIIQPF